ncbi:unnamed protein product [Arctia plantaginis]|uniref:Uncharacterized protein n=1 Tax=Arctia plantaginis TaxID=874455 RepID=A0A8S0Z2M4_ARCPL|nr:unnamed protein product [Arctia plantaginis]
MVFQLFLTLHSNEAVSFGQCCVKTIGVSLRKHLRCTAVTRLSQQHPESIIILDALNSSCKDSDSSSVGRFGRKEVRSEVKL